MASQGPDERGKRWLQTQVQQLLTARAVSFAARAAGDPACAWGREPATATTLYIFLAGHPEPQALHFRRATILSCGSGLYMAQQRAVMGMRRTLKHMGILP